jgi:hypothetical protein
MEPGPFEEWIFYYHPQWRDADPDRDAMESGEISASCLEFGHNDRTVEG